ncbi:DUF3570 domain-containing protein [Lutibacter sp.]|uniref:DUF3570 domain-containing protein n=1 Tax=Lutibacter sp. TaxID=1925666 RepID=UPI0025BD76F8|nr:DUF3570 domain-containing protein [Lutibacter sp.]MCF6180664.1 DUF3570 domain-containing protein [Lutibacter sp.]
MKKISFLALLFISFYGYSQTLKTTSKEYTKRVLENAEVDLISSLYGQKGDNAAVTGGIGNEKLTDIASNIIVSIPVNDNDVISVNATISAYTSASSSNLNPFDYSGSTFKNQNGDSDKNEDKSNSKNKGGFNAKSGASQANTNNVANRGATPWLESTGASRSDVWVNGTVDYSHSSKDRNTIINGNLSTSHEYDYQSFGIGGGIAKLFNQKNTEIDLKGNVYLDNWNPRYPTEIHSYNVVNGNLNNGFFSGVTIYDQNRLAIDKNSPNAWKPINTTLVTDKKRNSYSASLSLSQIISKKAQLSLFVDVVQQKGWLSNPMQRVYFSDIPNFYIGNASSINNYTSKSNIDVFQLADDIERLPNTRLKIPFGARFNYFINEKLTLRTYYRYYSDDWGINSQTASIEIPFKISDKFTLYPSYRYYTQTAAKYFAPYEKHLSTEQFYTSDYDLSKYNSSQIGFGISYTDIFTERKIWKLGLKSVDLKYSNYKRNTGLSAGIVSLGFKFVMN